MSRSVMAAPSVERSCAESAECSIFTETPSRSGTREPVLGANVFRLAQTAPDYLRALLQVGGSPFDCAGLGSTDRMRMACKSWCPHGTARRREILGPFG